MSAFISAVAAKIAQQTEEFQNIVVRQQHVDHLCENDPELKIFILKLENEIERLEKANDALRDDSDRFETLKSILNGEEYKEEY